MPSSRYSKWGRQKVSTSRYVNQSFPRHFCHGLNKSQEPGSNASQLNDWILILKLLESIVFFVFCFFCFFFNIIRSWVSDFNFSYTCWKHKKESISLLLIVICSKPSLIFLLVYVDDMMVHNNSSQLIYDLIHQLSSSFELKNLSPYIIPLFQIENTYLNDFQWNLQFKFGYITIPPPKKKKKSTK